MSINTMAMARRRSYFDTTEHWPMMPVVAANRIGAKTVGGRTQSYYGSSIIAGPDSRILADAPRNAEAALLATFDQRDLADNHAARGMFRDRRPELYGVLATAYGGDY